MKAGKLPSLIAFFRRRQRGLLQKINGSVSIKNENFTTPDIEVMTFSVPGICNEAIAIPDIGDMAFNVPTICNETFTVPYSDGEEFSP